MHSEFAIAIDPIFDFVLQAIAEIDRGSEVSVQAIYAQLLNQFDRADALHGTSTKWQLAKYALASWIDEMFLNTPWSGANWWREHILEMEFFQTRLCAIRFFQLAQQASAETDRDALEVFVNCVQLGFRGVYAQTDSVATASRIEGLILPSTIDQWVRQMEPRLDVHRLRQRVPVVARYPQRMIEGAPPLPAERALVWWCLAVVVLLLVNGWMVQNLAMRFFRGE